MTTALLLIAHGSREPEANADLQFVSEQVQTRGIYDIVEPAFLELAQPTIEEAVRSCISRGADCVILVPYFLSAGVHVRRDLEEHKNRLAQALPQVRFALAEPLGRSELLIDLAIQRARETGLN